MFKKEELRKEYLAKRKLFSESEIEQQSIKIRNWLFSRLMIHRFENIHVFLPIAKHKEVNTWLIVETLQKDFPVNIILSRSETDGTLKHYIYDKTSILVENKWGISEPAPEEAKQILANQIDMVLVPLLIFDKLGHRVGYGKGYYDRFLADCRADVLKVGLSFFEPIKLIDDTYEYDIELDICITPNRIWSF